MRKKHTYTHTTGKHKLHLAFHFMQEWRKKWKRNIDTECVTRAVCHSTLAYRERLSRRGRKRREGQTSFKMEKLLGFSPLPLHPPSFLCEHCNSFCVVRGHILVLWRLTSSSVRPRNVSALQLKCTMISRANAVNGITFRVISFWSYRSGERET